MLDVGHAPSAANEAGAGMEDRGRDKKHQNRPGETAARALQAVDTLARAHQAILCRCCCATSSVRFLMDLITCVAGQDAPKLCKRSRSGAPCGSDGREDGAVVELRRMELSFARSQHVHTCCGCM